MREPRGGWRRKVLATQVYFSSSQRERPKERRHRGREYFDDIHGWSLRLEVVEFVLWRIEEEEVAGNDVVAGVDVDPGKFSVERIALD